MTTTITRFHHAAIKAAVKRGYELNVDDQGKVVAIRLTDGALSVARVDSPAELVELHDAGELEFEAPRNKATRCGVMVADYHARYSANPHGPGCNDDLDCTLRDYLTIPPREKGERPRIDLALLREVADANGVWNQGWSVLNPGMQRMNLANRLRGKLRNNPGFHATIGDKAGRFGIAK